METAATTSPRRGAAWLVFAIACASVATGLEARDRPAAAAVVDLRLSVDPRLAETARQVMLDEATTIWRRAGIELRWLPESAETSALPVTVVPSDPGRDDHDDSWRLAKLLRHGGRPRAAVVSIAACAQALERVERILTEPARRRERRLGLVMERALAHEIGHYLLGSGSHRKSGLMRASILAAELAGLSSLGFDLDDEARASVHANVADVTDRVAAGGTP